MLAEISDPLVNSYADSLTTGGVHYYYIVVANYNLGISSPSTEVSVIATSAENDLSLLPNSYCLHPTYPNPFNPSTTIKYEIPGQTQKDNINVALKVYDALGREVATLVNERLQPGYYQVEFNAADLASGVYYYRISAGTFIQTKKMIVLK